MVDRTVKVSLTANIANYAKGMDEAAKKTREVGAQGEKLAKMRESFDAIGKSSLAMGTVIGAAVTLAVARFAEFDAAMSNVEAATNESASNMDALREAAISAGASTVFSATEAAGAIEELAKAGVSTADILSGALSGSLDLAAAGQLGVARAAEITATALNQFGLQGDQAGHVADVLAAGAGKAMGSVEDLANGLKFVGPVAASMGVSFEETTGVLALFAQQGIIGEQAGTSLRGVLASLTSPSAQARAEIERLGLTMYDVQTGAFLGLENAAGQLSQAYGAMDGASRDASLGVIFGRETVTAATALYKAGAGGVDEWTAAVDDSGFAADVARKRLDNLKGDLEALQGALDSALIETGSAANDTLRAMAQAVTGLVQMYGDLPEPVQQATLLIGGTTAAVTLAGGAALLAVPKFLEMRSTITKAGISMKGLSVTAGGAGIALGGLFAVIGELARTQAEAAARAQAYSETLADGTNLVTDATRKMIVENLAANKQVLWWTQSSAFDNAKTLGVSLDTVADATMGNVDALRKLNAATDLSNKNSFERSEIASRMGISVLELETATGQLRDSVRGESSSIEESIRLNEQKNEVTTEGTVVTLSAADAYLTAAGEASVLTDQLDQLISTIDEANGKGQDAISANLDYKNALAGVDETIRKAREGQEGYSLSLDESTQAGRDNKQMLVDLAQSSTDAAEKQFALDNNTANYRATLEAGRQALIDRATQLGMNADEAGALADQIYRIPSSTEWEAIAKTAAANTEIARFIADAEKKVIRIGVSTYAKDGPNGQLRISTPGAPDKYAFGGPIYGPGGPRDDLVPILASNGEHMWTAEEVRAAGGHARVAALRQQMLAGGDAVGRYAAGGPVTTRQDFTYYSSAPAQPIIHVTAPPADGGLRPGDKLVLAVNGQQFDAYVQHQADGRIAADAGSRRRGFGQGVSRN